jgi:enoyl-CoA hydratase/carnithine racemase
MAETTSEPVRIEDRGSTRWLWLNRPAARNAQSAALLTALHRAVDDTAANPDVRVVVLAGAGPSFSAGHDLKEIVVNEAYRENNESVEGRLWQELDLFVGPVEALRNLRVPTIARVQGHCLAASLMLVEACDLVVVADDARFGSAVTRDMGAADVELPTVAWALGERRAKQMLWTSETLDAEQAQTLGLVNWIVSLDELDAKVEAVAATLTEVPREALALSKLSFRFMEDRRGRADAAAYHFLAHQLSHHTTDAAALLARRVAELEEKLRSAGAG